MKLTNEELQKIYCGAYSFAETEDGYLQAYQYTQAQMDYFKEAFDFWYDRSMASSAKTITFSTKATQISFDYKIIWSGSDDTFEVCVNGQITAIYYMKDMPEEGTLSISLESTPGQKEVSIYLPVDATVLIRDFEINDTVTPVPKGEKVLWLGDSITQGYGPLRSAQTYVSVANRLLGYDVLNQGIGGYIYDKNSILPMEGYKPDKIIVSLGTNQYADNKIEMVEEFYETLTKLYPDTPILCISPIWRGDHPENMDVFLGFCEQVKSIAGSYEQVSVLDGLTLVPHLPEYFLDLLHPNELGAEIYGRNLVDYIKFSGF